MLNREPKTNKPDIERILKLEELFVTDPTQWVDYIRRERAKTDYEHSLNARLEEGLQRGMQKGLKKGIKEGKVEGLREAKLETARKMLSRNMDIETIADLTGLTEEDILKLAN